MMLLVRHLEDCVEKKKRVSIVESRFSWMSQSPFNRVYLYLRILKGKFGWLSNTRISLLFISIVGD